MAAVSTSQHADSEGPAACQARWPFCTASRSLGPEGVRSAAGRRSGRCFARGLRPRSCPCSLAPRPQAPRAGPGRCHHRGALAARSRLQAHPRRSRPRRQRCRRPPRSLRQGVEAAEPGAVAAHRRSLPAHPRRLPRHRRNDRNAAQQDRGSERRACAALGQHRSTQRKRPRGRDDEERLHGRHHRACAPVWPLRLPQGSPAAARPPAHPADQRGPRPSCRVRRHRGPRAMEHTAALGRDGGGGPA